MIIINVSVLLIIFQIVLKLMNNKINVFYVKKIKYFIKDYVEILYQHILNIV